jgi:hypothetical protein
MKFHPKVFSVKKVFVAHRNSVENRHRFTFTFIVSSSKVYQMKFLPKVLRKFLLHIAVL